MVATARQFSVFTKAHGEVRFESTLTDDEARAICAAQSSSFAQDIANRINLSEKQLAWLHKIAVDATAKPGADATSAGAVEGTAAAPAVDLTNIMMMVLIAKRHLKFPKIKFQGMTISLAGERAKVPGSASIVDGERWLGRILPDGTLQRAKGMTDDEQLRLVSINADPVDACRTHGHRTGNCCFCGLDLTDERSVSVGYGPICAAHYGLPWGDDTNS